MSSARRGAGAMRLKGLVRNNPFLSGLDNRLSGLFHNLFTHRKT